MRAAVIALLGLIGGIVTIAAISYIVSPAPPFGFYYDLGVNIWATSVIAASIKSVQDFVDALGWAGWGNVTQFALNPMTTYAVTVPLADAFGGNAIVAIKATQMVELALAAVSMALLFLQVYGRSHWAAFAGLIYALTPQVLLMIRGNADFGLAVALAPLCIAIPVFISRRFGIGGLPLSGAVAGLLSLCVSAEFLFFHGIPAFCIAASVAFERRVVWFVATAAGFAAMMFCGAYVAFATVSAGTFFSSAATTVALLSSGELSRYGEGITGLCALVMNEFIINPRPEFTIRQYLPVLVCIGLLLWLLAWFQLIRALRQGITRLELAIAVTGITCALLSLGASLPMLNVFWQVVSQIPGLNSLRTPDRFISLTVVVVVLLASNGLRSLATSQQTRALSFSRVALGVLSIFALTAFFASRIAIGDPSSWNAKEPDLAAVSRIAVAAGGRVVSTAQVRNGSTFDTPLYGAPAPFIRFQDDIISRYEADGFGGAALLGRMATRTFVTSPNWASDGAPYAAHVFRRASTLRTVLVTRHGVMVQEVKAPRGFVSLVHAVCLQGGPGLIEYTVALKLLNDSTIVRDAKSCTANVFLDDAPVTAQVRGSLLTGIDGITMFPRTGVLRDIDYRSPPGGYLLNIPWYRNSIDGDSPASESGAVSLDAGNTGAVSVNFSSGGIVEPVVRMVCHSLAVATYTVDDHSQTFTCQPRIGFQVIELRKSYLSQGVHPMRLAVVKIARSTLRSSTWHVGFDSLLLLRPNSAAPPLPRNAAWFFSSDRFGTLRHHHRVFGFAGTRWIGRGVYTVVLIRRGGAVANDPVSVDGRSARVIRIARSGWHRLVWQHGRSSGAVIAFVPRSWPREPGNLSSYRIANQRWSFNVDRIATVEAAVFPDGNWYVTNDEGAAVSGRRCDLANTCFIGLTPGRYTLAHRWPAYITYGLSTTVATWLLCVVILLLAQRQHRYATSVERTSANAA